MSIYLTDSGTLSEIELTSTLRTCLEEGCIEMKKNEIDDMVKAFTNSLGGENISFNDLYTKVKKRPEINKKYITK